MLLGAVLVAVVLRAGPELLPPDCTVRVGGEQVELTSAQARTATTLAAVTRKEGRTQQDLARALGPALEDPRDGLTPQQASQALAAGGPEAEPETFSLGRALLGYGTDRLGCRADLEDLPRQAEGEGGLTPRAQEARDRLLAAFGRLPLGGYAPGGVRTGHIPGSAHYEGRAVDVFFRPVTERNQQEGWTAAQWLVAHAEELDLAVVIFDEQLWSAARSDEGWRPYRHPSGNTTNPVLLHHDHVHLDVQRGSA